MTGGLKWKLFGLGDCSLNNLLWNVSWMMHSLTLNVDSRHDYRASNFLYLFDSICLGSYIYCYVFNLFYNWGWVYPVTGDYTSIIIIISLSFASSISTMKLTYMSLHRKKIMNIIDAYRAIDATVDPASRYGVSMLARLRDVKKRSLIFWCSYVGNSTVYIFLPLLTPGYNLPENSMQLYGLEPMDQLSNYYLAYTAVVLSGIMATLVPSNVTVLLIVLVGYIEAHIIALTEEYNQLYKDSMSSDDDLYFHGTESSEIGEHERKTFNESIREKLNFLVSRHGEFVIMLRKICRLFEGIIAFEFALTMIALCAVLLGGLENTFLQIPYTIIQLMVDSLVGQRLLDAGSLFEKSVYNCGWENFDASNMKTVQVVLQCSQRPLRLTAGGITTLCYESFMTITKSVYSAYATLSKTV